MPWHIERKGEEWCVIKDSDGSSAGCHATKERASRQMRALYANEDSMRASAENGEPKPLRLEFSSLHQDVAPALIATIEALTARIQENEEALRYVTDGMKQIAETIAQDRAELTQALTAAVAMPTPEAPVVHVSVPEQAAPVVNVEVPEQTTPEVNVTFAAPERVHKRKVQFERDHLQRITGAEIEESEEWPTTP